ncbi:G protein-coupled receptor gpr1 [Coniosporium apollinis]|uniref:G protein-coupled receptor gpr1 n=1 Tax=Coniosporium apollinis TaxID=61459 RepID=A0ABQ9P6G8_9PEZI|nr:G protein-coupled receptor gpr1 [Coniosporium apollinis]
MPVIAGSVPEHDPMRHAASSIPSRQLDLFEPAARHGSSIFARAAGSSDVPRQMRYSNTARLAIQYTALTSSTLSIISCSLAFYWFCRMRKRFRHKLIMLLVLGDLVRAMWYFVHAIVSVGHGAISTSSPFCQTSGFMVQWGTEATAMQILLPIFRASNSDGLFRWRHWVYLCIVSVSTLMSGLAFVNPHDAFVSNGPFCSLPIRPFWYRLALAWIPRYVIIFIVLSLAIAVYTYVGFHFRSYNEAERRSSLPSLSPDEPSQVAVESHHEGPDISNSPGVPALEKEDSPQQTDDFAQEKDDFAQETTDFDAWRPDFVRAASGRRPSVVTFQTNDSIPTVPKLTSDVGKSDAQPKVNGLVNSSKSQRRKSIASFSTAFSRSTSFTVSECATVNDYARPSESEDAFPGSSAEDQTSRANKRRGRRRGPKTADQHMARTRANILRQLGLLFIYPVIYIVLWIPPFVFHCMQYSDYWAHHPPASLSVVVIFCLTIMGAADCLVFSMRERPWRKIPGTDKSFLGSFRPAKTSKNSDDDDEKAISAKDAPSRSHILKNPFSRLTSGHGSLNRDGRSERAVLARERAKERLAAEQADRRERNKQRQVSAAAVGEASAEDVVTPGLSTAESRNWWDRRGSSWAT